LDAAPVPAEPSAPAAAPNAAAASPPLGPSSSATAVPVARKNLAHSQLAQSQRFALEITLEGRVLFLVAGEEGRLAALVEESGQVVPHRFERGAWQALPLPPASASKVGESALGIFFGRDNRPRLMGHRLEGSAPRMVYLRFRDGRWQDQRSEVGSLASDASVLFGVLGEDDPEVVCKVGGICLRKSRRGWKELSNTLPATAVLRAFGGQGYALTAEGLFVASDAGFQRVGPAAPWATEATGFWVGEDGAVTVAEPAAGALHHLDDAASAWRFEAAPIRGPRDVVGPPGDRWVGGDGGLAHEEGGAFAQVGEATRAVHRVLLLPSGVVASGPSGVVRVVPAARAVPAVHP
jgi:hypothetical protein